MSLSHKNNVDGLDWFQAERWITDAMSMYGNVPVAPSKTKKRNKLYELHGRFQKGERTRSLWNEIKNFTGN